MKVTLLILAFNEERFIDDIVHQYKDEFDELVVVNDQSNDKTSEILDHLAKKIDNLTVLTNNKNKGAGKSLENGINFFNNSENDILIKIDGDNQFFREDILKIKQIMLKEKYDFIKCDRFWYDGISGNIPTVRYLGNSLASFLIKFSTASWNLNDPLNGLFAFSKKTIDKIKLPRLFYRYGYPFYITTEILKMSITNNIKIGQFQNKVRYEDEKSNLNPFIMLFKLSWYTIQNYYSKIWIKLKVSNLQVSAILDLISQLLGLFSILSLLRVFYIRFVSFNGPQGIWFIIFIIFLSFSIYLINISQKIESKITKTKIIDIKG